MITVPVELGDRSYDVLVGDGAAGKLSTVVAERVPTARRSAIVTDENIAAQAWFAALDPGVPFDVHTVEPGERAKRPSTVETLCRSFVRRGLARTDVVVAVGGGAVSDVAGFAAATYHRGIAYCTVATTLLAQVDAAIGGKTGVNLPEGKNLMGAFWQPVGVMCDTALLATLPAPEWESGRGEMAKYVFLGEPSLADLPFESQVARCVAIKARAVVGDERETSAGSDGRALLNYGHTLAHALEGATGTIRHGEAVAVGLVYAALLARRLGRIDDERVREHRRIVERFGLSPSLKEAVPEPVDPTELLRFMVRDKKAAHDLTFVLDGPTGLEVVHGVDSDDVLAALEDLACW